MGNRYVKEAPEGLPEGDEDARYDAQRGVRIAAYGQEVIPEAGAGNR